jgi:hypothetical protein
LEVSPVQFASAHLNPPPVQIIIFIAYPLAAMVVPIDELACLDLLLWLRTGECAASRLNSSQPRVSRSVRKVSNLFGLSLSRENREWDVQGDQTLLNAERRVHQQYRWSMGHSLRVEGQYFSESNFFDPSPEGWVLGNFDYLEIHTPLRHLRNRTIDAWIGCYPDVPEEDDPDLTSFPLTRLPVHLVVGQNHPLLELGDKITLEIVKEYPTLAMPDGAYPKVQEVVQGLGLWMLTQDCNRYSQWQRKAQNPDDLVIGYATAITISYFPDKPFILPLQIPLEVGDSLVVRRDYANHPRLLCLLDFLRNKSALLAQQYPDIRIPSY